MAQQPLQVDQVQIEPGLSGTRLVNAEQTTYELQFSDPLVTAVLSDLVGTRNLTGVYLVGRAGDGAPYTAIQDAIDQIPDTSSKTTPSVVLIYSGLFNENLTIDKDGVYLVGLGGVTITNSAADATIKIQDAAETTPEKVVLQNLCVVNTNDAEECVLIEGAGTYATGTVTVNTSPLAAGDVVTIGGVPLTGVSGARTSGSDDFSVDGGTVDAIAAEIAEAIDDTANSFTAVVTASASLGVVTLTSVVPGAAGNAVTLSVTTTPPGGMTASGATLTGGSSSGSRVAYDEVSILDCELLAQGNGGYQVRADTINNVRVQGGTWRGSSSTSLCMATNCAAFRVFGVEWMRHFQLAYDTGNDQPAITSSEYAVKHGGEAGDVACNILGAGSMVLACVPSVGNLTLGGDRAIEIDHCRVGTVSVQDTTALTVVASSRGAATVPIGTPTLEEDLHTDSWAFAASASEIVPFEVPQPDTNYGVFLDSPVLGTDVKVTAKATGSFTISASAPITGTVYYDVRRNL